MMVMHSPAWSCYPIKIDDTSSEAICRCPLGIQLLKDPSKVTRDRKKNLEILTRRTQCSLEPQDPGESVHTRCIFSPSSPQQDGHSAWHSFCGDQTLTGDGHTLTPGVRDGVEGIAGWGMS
ncbi:hypothetical protein ElyMa_003178000 [Elysia marginata]|uniref:Uncharacterized protein n=1 Tax=Elysia marginata TaxID=1093978 RepID=A0AAV4IZL2_9GAST|nr:hypothetical protein ElyMa_003178000 [Elysia marginata]